MSDSQARATRAGLRTLVHWSVATEDPETVLLDALRREDRAEILIGLATVGRLLAVELGVRSGRDEVTVLADLRDMLDRLHKR